MSKRPLTLKEKLVAAKAAKKAARIESSSSLLATSAKAVKTFPFNELVSDVHGEVAHHLDPLAYSFLGMASKALFALLHKKRKPFKLIELVAIASKYRWALYQELVAMDWNVRTSQALEAFIMGAVTARNVEPLDRFKFSIMPDQKDCIEFISPKVGHTQIQDYSFSMAIGRVGSEEYVAHLRGKGYPIVEAGICQGASEEGHIELVRSRLSEDFPQWSRVASVAIQSGHLDVIELIAQAGKLSDRWNVEYFLRPFVKDDYYRQRTPDYSEMLLPVLLILEQSGVDLSQDPVVTAVLSSNSPDALVYMEKKFRILSELSLGWSSKSCFFYRAVRFHHYKASKEFFEKFPRDMLTALLRDHGNTLIAALLHKSNFFARDWTVPNGELLEFVQYLISQGYTIPNDVLARTTKQEWPPNDTGLDNFPEVSGSEDWFDCIDFLFDKSVTIPVDVIEQLIRHFPHVEKLKALLVKYNAVHKSIPSYEKLVSAAFSRLSSQIIPVLEVIFMGDAVPKSDSTMGAWFKEIDQVISDTASREKVRAWLLAGSR